MALVKASCKKCGETFTLDIGDAKRELVEKILKSRTQFHCDAGNHMELTNPLEYWTIDWDSLKQGKAPTDLEWLNEMQEEHGKLWDTSSMQSLFEVKGFSMGACVATHKASGENVVLDFTASPSGKRYYFVRGGLNRVLQG